MTSNIALARSRLIYTASAARIFGWDSNKPGVQLNQQFVISQEMIDRIREAADADDPYKKPAISDENTGA